DGIRYRNVTGVQTCALPISRELPGHLGGRAEVITRGTDRLVRLLRGLGLVPVVAGLVRHVLGDVQLGGLGPGGADRLTGERDRRSEERRVGKECRSRWSPSQ